MENNLSVGERFQYFRDLDQTRFCKLDPNVVHQAHDTFLISNDAITKSDDANRRNDVKAVTFAAGLKNSGLHSMLTKDTGRQVHFQVAQGQEDVAQEGEKWEKRTGGWSYAKNDTGPIPDPLLVAEVGNCMFYPSVSEPVDSGYETMIHMPDSDPTGLLDTVRESDQCAGLVPVTYSIPPSEVTSLPPPMQRKLETIGINLDEKNSETEYEQTEPVAEPVRHQVAQASSLPPINAPTDGAGDCRTKLDEEIGELNLFQEPEYNYCGLVWDEANNMPLIYMPDEK
jgi:hypothetical protein